MSSVLTVRPQKSDRKLLSWLFILNAALHVMPVPQMGVPPFRWKDFFASFWVTPRPIRALGELSRHAAPGHK